MFIAKIARNCWIILRGLSAALALFFLNPFIPPPEAAAQLVPSPGGATVHDTVNNVNWLSDANLAASNRFGLPVCSGSGTQPCVNASGSMRYQAAAAWVAAMNAANYLGHSNWQLPTTPLTDKTCPKVGPNGGSFGFGCTASALASLYNALGLKAPNTAVPIPSNAVGPLNNLQPYLYWSQTSAGTNQGNASFSFATGWQGANTLPNFLYVLPMVPGKIAGTPPATGNGLEVNPDGQTVYDPVTNITWLANANLAASNTFGLPRCTDPTTPAICVAQDGAMTFDAANQFLANMNSAKYLGQNNWQMPSVDPTCPGYNCGGTRNPMGALFYDQLGFSQGMSAVVVPDIAVGPFHNIQPYLYWTCQGATIQSACSTDVPSPNFEWSYSFGSGFQGTDLLANDLYVTAYYVGPPTSVIVPSINSGGTVNGASFTLTSASLAPGSIAAVFGSNLTDGTACVPPNCGPNFDSNGKAIPTLAGAQISFNGTAAPILSTPSPSQLNVQIPVEVAGAPSAQIEITTKGVTGVSSTVSLAPLSPGLISINASGKGQGAILNDKDANLGVQSLVAPTGSAPNAHPAAAGDVIEIYATGLGAMTPSVPTGMRPQGLPQTVTKPTVTIGGVPATALFSGLASCCVGLNQVNVTVPAGAPTGPSVPVVLTIGGVSSNTVTIAIQ